MYAEIPQEPKSRASSFHARTSGSDESLHTSEQLNPGDLTKDQNSLSNPDLSEIHKTKALTLPARGYRTGNSVTLDNQPTPNVEFLMRHLGPLMKFVW